MNFDALATHLAAYLDATPAPLVWTQATLLVFAAATLGTGAAVRLRLLGPGTPPGTRSVRELADSIGILAPLLGVLGTVIGAAQVLPDIASGHMALVGDDLGCALYTTAVGVTTAAIATVAMLLLPGPTAASEPNGT